MKYRKKILLWGCLLMLCLLTACQQGDSERIGTTLTTAVSAKTPEATQESTRETGTEQEMTTAMETIMETSQTIPATMPETGSMTETDKAGENSETDQGEFTWLDQALAECLNKSPEELTESDYLSVTSLNIYRGNRIYKKEWENQVFIWADEKNAVLPFGEREPLSIDINDIAKCRNLRSLNIELSFEQYSETYIKHYDRLSLFDQMRRLVICLNDPVYENGIDIADYIEDLSFIEEMPELNELILQNIDLSADLSPLFLHKMERVQLRACGITEKSFCEIDKVENWPIFFDLSFNQISDASILTAAQKPDGSGIKILLLSGNPLVNLGDYITHEKLERAGAVTDMELSLDKTIFEEYSVNWYTD